MKTELNTKVDFSFIRYANCWEDADTLLMALDIPKEMKILSIASAGDNSLSLLVKEPSIIAAVDLNPTQLYLTEFKKVCFAELDYKEVLNILGFTSCNNRIVTYNKIRLKLCEESRAFWDNRSSIIKNGIINAGKFEKYFQAFVKYVLPLIHSNKTVQHLFESKNEEAQETFYFQIWNNYRWRILFKAFFSKAILGRFGRDPEFLKQVTIPVGDFIFKQSEKQLKNNTLSHNHILRYCLTANFGNLLPHYVRPENFNLIKSQLHKLELVKGYAQQSIHTHGKFDAMNLSNIFEYQNETVFKHTANQLCQGMNKNCKSVYWNLMVERKMSSILPNLLVENKTQSAELKIIDKGFFYQNLIIESRL